jgi:hypothetical protein
MHGKVWSVKTRRREVRRLATYGFRPSGFNGLTFGLDAFVTPDAGLATALSGTRDLAGEADELEGGIVE